MNDLMKKVSHPVIEHKMSLLRDKKTNPQSFRQIMGEIAQFLTYESTKNLELKEVEIETPVSKTKAKTFKDDPLLIAILRAGLGMLDGALNVLPNARVGHIGIYRDKTMGNTIEYYFKIPKEAEGRPILLCDPMIATGDTMIAALDRLKEYKVGKITVMAILVSHEALSLIHENHPDVSINYISLEQSLNEVGYLIPGLGDAGDRLYGTL